MRILVTGGAGYIGSHTAKALALAGHEPIVLDDLRRGNRWAVRWGPFIDLDLTESAELRRVFQWYRFDAVIHCAALAYVGESMDSPAEYFRNNVLTTLNLLDAMREVGANRIVFSSSCSTYGDPEHIPIREDHPQRPLNPYGETKLAAERMLHWYGEAYGIQWAALRYFNAAGADPDGEIGEAHDPETHLIPRAIAAAYGDAPPLQIFGTDYDTPDGTALRDYVHVTDIADAHKKAVERMVTDCWRGALNLGTGRRQSVLDVVAAIERVTGRKVPARWEPRRPGDAPALVACNLRAARELKWTPRHSSLNEIVETADRWYRFSRSTGHVRHEREQHKTAV